MVKNGFTKTDIEEMSQPEMTAYINLIIGPIDKKPESSSDKKPESSSSDTVQRYLSTKRKNGRKSDTST